MRSALHAAALCLLVACRTQGEAEKTKETEPSPLPAAAAAASTGISEPDASSREQIEALLSLGYLDYTQAPANPKRSGVTRHDAQRSYPGYNLYDNRKPCAVSLVDAEGQLVQSWRVRECNHLAGTELLPNGDLAVVGSAADDDSGIDDEARFLARLSWNGNLLWKTRITAHHDVDVTPSGQLLTLTIDFREIPMSSGQVKKIKDESVVLLSPEGQVLQKVSLYDVFSSEPSRFQFLPSVERIRANRDHVVLFHSNAVQWIDFPRLQGKHPIYGPDTVLVCSRHQDAFAIFDWKTRKLLWSWGQDQLQGPHAATLIENGNVLVFDNGLGRNYSRVLEIDPQTQKVVWEYKAPDPKSFYTRSRGSNQRLPNGNTLITNSDEGQAFEVTPEGQVVWEFLCPNLNARGERWSIVRLKRYETSYVERILQKAGKRAG